MNSLNSDQTTVFFYIVLLHLPNVQKIVQIQKKVNIFALIV